MTDSHLVAMTTAERDLWLAFKAFVREQQGRTPAVVPAPGRPAAQVLPLAPGLALEAVEAGLCGVRGKGTTFCQKPSGHGQRHRYEAPKPVHKAPPRSWVKIGSFKKQSGSRSYLVEVGYPCKVEGVRGNFKIIGVEQHTETGKINVEVTNDRSGHSRVFPADKVIYKRPRKVTS